MGSEAITKVANDAVAVLAKVLRFYPPFANAKMKVDVEGEDLAIIQFEGDDMFIYVELVEEPVQYSLRKTLHTVAKFSPGYYKHVGGGRWSPPEVDEVTIDTCDNVIDAIAALVKLDFVSHAGNMLDNEAFADEMAYVNANMEQIEEAIRG